MDPNRSILEDETVLVQFGLAKVNGQFTLYLRSYEYDLERSENERYVIFQGQ
jgi:hypothetical protein